MEEEKAKREAALKGEINDDAKAARNAQETAERRARLGADAIVGVLNGPITKAFESLMKVMGALAKGIAHFAKWLGGPDFTAMFDTPEEVAAKVKDNNEALEATTAKIERTRLAMKEPAVYKEELIKNKKLAEDAYIEKARETENLRELYSKEEDTKKKAILKDELIEARKEEFAAKQAADAASLQIRNAKFSMTKEAGDQKIMQLEKEKLALLEKGKQLASQQQTQTAGAPAAVAEARPTPPAPPPPPAPSKPADTEPVKPFKGNSKEFYDKIYNILLEEAKKAKVANPEAVARLGASQSALETGYGKATAGGNNYFGIKGSKKNAGEAVSTQEWDPKQGKMITIKDTFRKYGSMEESAADYIKFLQENKRYKAVLAAKTTEEAIAAQGKTGYATDPNYTAKLTAIDARGRASTQQASAPKPPVTTTQAPATPVTTPQGANGLRLSGPMSGYPVTAHGKETLIPDFKIPDLIQSIKDTTAAPLGDITATKSPATATKSEDTGLGMIFDMMSEKFDVLISRIEEGNDTSDKLLKTSRV